MLACAQLPEPFKSLALRGLLPAWVNAAHEHVCKRGEVVDGDVYMLHAAVGDARLMLGVLLVAAVVLTGLPLTPRWLTDAGALAALGAGRWQEGTHGLLRARQGGRWRHRIQGVAEPVWGRGAHVHARGRRAGAAPHEQGAGERSV